MRRKFTFIILLPLFLAISPFAGKVFANSNAAEYYSELGVNSYKLGKYDDALAEFNRALMAEPDNKTAKDYINKIFSREDAINQTFTQTSEKNDESKKAQEVVNHKLVPDWLKISGEVQLGLGITSKDVIWKRSNADLNEENYRILSNTAFDRRSNSFDPNIFDKLSVNFDTPKEEGLSFHSNVSVDPWSFTGKTNKITLSGAGGDADTSGLGVRRRENGGCHGVPGLRRHQSPDPSGGRGGPAGRLHRRTAARHAGARSDNPRRTENLGGVAFRRAAGRAGCLSVSGAARTRQAGGGGNRHGERQHRRGIRPTG